jgi:predicted adenine nucleotide alpha hydrolase (AANH) superfamily ATPase
MLPTKLINRKVRLTSDANDNIHPEKIYARQGERVKVVEEMGDVLVVANKYKEKFCIPKDKLE